MSAASRPPLVQAGQGGLDQGQVCGKEVPAEAALRTSPGGPSALAGTEVPAPPQLPPSPRCAPQGPPGACPALRGGSVLRYQQAVPCARTPVQGWEAGSCGCMSHQTPGPRKIGGGRAGGRQDSQQDLGTLLCLGPQFPHLPAAGAVERKFRRDSLFCPDELDSLFSYFDAGAAAAGPRSKCCEGPSHPCPLPLAQFLRLEGPVFLAGSTGSGLERVWGSSRAKAEIASRGSGVTWPLSWRLRP